MKRKLRSRRGQSTWNSALPERGTGLVQNRHCSLLRAESYFPESAQTQTLWQQCWGGWPTDRIYMTKADNTNLVGFILERDWGFVSRVQNSHENQ